MVATYGRTVTVFGGIGFLGRRIVRHLRYRGFPVRIASRHPGGIDSLALMIRNFNPSRPTFKMSDQSWMPLPTPTAL
jgi:uncharacterized protein YbjT (DUF2867 family)